MAEVIGTNYAIPTNAPIGEYTYLLLNKELLNKYSYKAEDFSTLTDQNTQNFLKRVSESSSDYVPLRSFTGELDVSNVQYFGVDENGHFSNTFSLFGGSYENNWNYLQQDQYTAFGSIFNDAKFMSQLTMLTQYKEKGYYGTAADAEKDFAVGYIKGGVEVMAEYGDEYELVVVERPVLNTYDLFNDMIAISSNTVSSSRSMEIVSYLYTNADFRNILLYGVEGTNFVLRESDVKGANGENIQYVERLNEDFMMSPEKTGNVVLSYPLKGQPLNMSDFYKKQNADARVSYIMGFTHDYNGMAMREGSGNDVSTLSANALNTLLEVSSTAMLEVRIGAILSMALMNEDYADFAELDDMLSEDYDEEQLDMQTMYYNWLIQTGLLVIDEE